MAHPEVAPARPVDRTTFHTFFEDILDEAALHVGSVIVELVSPDIEFEVRWVDPRTRQSGSKKFWAPRSKVPLWVAEAQEASLSSKYTDYIEGLIRPGKGGESHLTKTARIRRSKWQRQGEFREDTSSERKLLRDIEADPIAFARACMGPRQQISAWEHLGDV